MSDSDSRAGTDFGHYQLRRLLGRGGMGEVYEAEDTRKDRTVALKLLPPAMAGDPVFRKRLQREARSAGRLQEPHVVPIHDYGEIDGVLYVDMRFIDGTDLRKMLSRYGPLTPARAVAIVRQIASALDAAHESGIMHRDVKPENVLITRDDFAYLVDFGIANAATDESLTELGTAVGTYAYMAPERFTNAEVTYRADIYALACVLYECLTGGQPYPVDSVSVVITAHLMQPIPQPSVVRPGIPAAFDQVIARGMAKDPKDRYATTGDLATAAHEALGSRDQDKADTILTRSAAATIPGVITPPPNQHPPTMPASFLTPAPGGAPPSSAPPTPAPFATTPPPYQPATSGPGGSVGPGGTGGAPPWQPPPSGPMAAAQPPSGPMPAAQMPSGPMAAAQPPKRSQVGIIVAVVSVILLVGGAVIALLLLTKSEPKPHEPVATSPRTTSETTTEETTTETTTMPTYTTAPAPQPPVTGSKFVVIAYSGATGAYGWANNYDNQDDANTAAMNFCKQYGGTDCKLAAWAKDGCAAVAKSSTSWHGGYGATIDAAEKNAIDQNQGGTIVFSKCSTG
ncbi:MAG: protein kinase [Mycobacteriaceae bacterium]|nr:protein kinase [Mycobacteriaceae bacterium]